LAVSSLNFHTASRLNLWRLADPSVFARSSV
jgi:hypothetical protein